MSDGHPDGAGRDWYDAAAGVTLASVFSGLSLYYGSETLLGPLLFLAFAITYYLAFGWALEARQGGGLGR